MPSRALGIVLAILVTAWPPAAAAPAKPYADPRAPRSVAGMVLEVRGDRVVISKVLPGSPAARAGLLAGDALLAVGEVNVLDLDLDPTDPIEVMRLIDKAPGPQLRLLVGRGSGTLGATLPIGDPGPIPAAAAGAVVGQPAPAFEARDFKGRAVSLASLRGKPILIDFWASWCPPCRDAALVLKRFADQYGDRIAIVGVSLDEDPKAFEAFVFNQHLPGYQIHEGGPYGPVSVAYGAPEAALPYSVLVSPDGTVVSAGRSLSDKEEAISRMAGPPASDRTPR